MANLEAPKLSVVSMKVQSADICSQRMLVRMRVMNPNDRELPIKGISYRIEVNDAEFAQGSRTRRSSCRRSAKRNSMCRSRRIWRVRWRSPVAQAFGGNARIPAGRHVSLSSGFLRRIPFDERGSVKLK